MGAGGRRERNYGERAQEDEQCPLKESFVIFKQLLGLGISFKYLEKTLRTGFGHETSIVCTNIALFTESCLQQMFCLQFAIF